MKNTKALKTEKNGKELFCTWNEKKGNMKLLKGKQTKGEETVITKEQKTGIKE